MLVQRVGPVHAHWNVTSIPFGSKKKCFWFPLKESSWHGNTGHESCNKFMSGVSVWTCGKFAFWRLSKNPFINWNMTRRKKIDTWPGGIQAQDSSGLPPFVWCLLLCLVLKMERHLFCLLQLLLDAVTRPGELPDRHTWGLSQYIRGTLIKDTLQL